MIDTIRVIIKNLDILTYYELTRACNKVVYLDVENRELGRVTSAKLKGSYDSNISIMLKDDRQKENVKGLYAIVECSIHKLIEGVNYKLGIESPQLAFYMLEKYLNKLLSIKLPKWYEWQIQRVDFSKNYKTDYKFLQENMSIAYPRRKVYKYEDETIYIKGTTTTLKIYDKEKEFQKHDMRKLLKCNRFSGIMLDEVKDIYRFELEIKRKTIIKYKRLSKKTLQQLYIEEFSKIMELIKFKTNIAIEKNDVYNNLLKEYNLGKANRLYSFWLTYIDNKQKCKSIYAKSVFYRNKADLKKANVALLVRVDKSKTNIINLTENKNCSDMSKILRLIS